eukprot:7744423-Alexandrium_andersonii.AAC.1
MPIAINAMSRTPQAPQMRPGQKHNANERSANDTAMCAVCSRGRATSPARVVAPRRRLTWPDTNLSGS